MSDTIVVMSRNEIQQIGTPVRYLQRAGQFLCRGLHRRIQHHARRDAEGLPLPLPAGMISPAWTPALPPMRRWRWSFAQRISTSCRWIRAC